MIRPSTTDGAQARLGPSSRGGGTAAVLALGTWGIGGRGWGGASSQRERIAAIRRAHELGVTVFDSAPNYGDAEELLGRALQDVRDHVSLATKVGPADDPRTSLEQSMRRLRTDRVDLFQLHEISDRSEHQLEVMCELALEGKASAVGLCNATATQLRRALSVTSVKTYQGPYNLFDRDVENGELPLCRENRLGFLAYRPLASGLLTEKWVADEVPLDPSDHRRRIYWFKGRELDRRRKVIARLATVARANGRTLPGLALGWARSRPGVTHVLMGARDERQVESNLATASPLSTEEMTAVDDVVASVFAPPRVRPDVIGAEGAWGERERFIVSRLDGSTTYEEIAAHWSARRDTPMIAAQVKVFADDLVAKDLAEP